MEESLMQPFIATHRKWGSSTEYNCLQKSSSCNSVKLKCQQDALIVADKIEILADTTLWSDKGHGLITTLCISEYEEM